MNPFAMNILIACIWLLLSAEPSGSRFILGFLIGFSFLALFQSILHSGSYTRRVLAFVRFLIVFLREFILANLNVVRIILFRSKESLHPDFIEYSTTGLKPFEILLLSYCISLTPGSTSVKVSDDFNTLTLHTLHVEDRDKVRSHIDRVLRRGILAFTREYNSES